MANWQIETKHCGTLTPKSAAKALKQLFKEEYPSKIMSELHCQDDSYLRSCASGRSDVTKTLGERLAAYLDKRAAKKEAASAATDTTTGSEDTAQAASPDSVAQDQEEIKDMTVKTDQAADQQQSPGKTKGALPPVMVNGVNLMALSRAQLISKLVAMNEQNESLQTSVDEQTTALKESQAESSQRQAQIESLEDMLEVSQKKCNELRFELGQLPAPEQEQALSDLKTQNADLRTAVAELTGQLEKANSHIAELDEALEAALAQRALSQTRVEQLGKEVSELRRVQGQQIADDDEIARLEGMVDCRDRTIKDLRDELMTLREEHLRDLETIRDLARRVLEAKAL